MKLIVLVLNFVILIGCTTSTKNKNKKNNTKFEAPTQLIKSEFQDILDSAKVEGGILVYDLNNKIYYSNNFEWANTGKLPASTFKIVNSIIALETGVVKNDSTIFKWNGEKRAFKSWEQDLFLIDAFQFSCVPCYQEIARKIGVERMQSYLKKLDYGEIVVNHDNIDIFWLEGESRVSQFQQIDFLKRLYLSELPISNKNNAIIKRIMILEKTDNYILRAKTGWSIRNGNNNGWFVGYFEKENETYFFATNIKPFEVFNMNLFPKIREEITIKALKQMNILY